MTAHKLNGLYLTLMLLFPVHSFASLYPHGAMEPAQHADIIHSPRSKSTVKVTQFRSSMAGFRLAGLLHGSMYIDIMNPRTLLINAFILFGALGA